MAKVEQLDAIRQETDLPVVANEQDVLERTSRTTPFVERVIITPQGADHLLALNENNRRLRQVRVDRFVQTLQEGHWYLTDSAITIDRNGIIVNGQHRLKGCAQAGVAIEVLLLTGVDPQTRLVIDTGAKRTFSDALVMNGVSYAHGIAAATALHYRYTHRQLALSAKGHAVKDRPSHDIMLDYLNEHPEIKEAAPEGMATYLLLRSLHASSATTFVAVTRQIDADASRDFIEKVKHGEGLRAGDPALALRNLAFRAQNVPTGWGSRRSEWSLAAMIKAWNHTRRGTAVTVLSVRNTETYPEAV